MLISGFCVQPKIKPCFVHWVVPTFCEEHGPRQEKEEASGLDSFIRKKQSEKKKVGQVEEGTKSRTCHGIAKTFRSPVRHCNDKIARCPMPGGLAVPSTTVPASRRLAMHPTAPAADAGQSLAFYVLP